MGQLEELSFWKRCSLVLALTCLAAIYGHLESTDVSAQVIAEAECKVAKERLGQYAPALTAVLNGKSIEVPGSTLVTCRAQHLGERS